jgi:hypothetical protein
MQSDLRRQGRRHAETVRCRGEGVSGRPEYGGEAGGGNELELIGIKSEMTYGSATLLTTSDMASSINIGPWLYAHSRKAVPLSDIRK